MYSYTKNIKYKQTNKQTKQKTVYTR